MTDTSIGEMVLADASRSEADDILQFAREQDVPIRDDSALAGALASLDIGRGVPPELFRAVAEALGFLHKMNAK